MGKVTVTEKVSMWLREHEPLKKGASLQAIYDAFPDIPPSTIKVAVNRITRGERVKIQGMVGQLNPVLPGNKQSVTSNVTDTTNSGTLVYKHDVIESNEFYNIYKENPPTELSFTFIEQHLLHIITSPMSDKDRTSRLKEVEMLLKVYSVGHSDENDKESEAIQGLINSLQSDSEFV